MIRALAAACISIAAVLPLALSQSKSMNQGGHRMELMLERYDGANWKSIDPALVLAQGDRVRFRFRTNFNGFLYVTNQSTSGKYEQLFPREETGQDNRIAASQEYQVPSTSVAFRIAGPAGHEVVYWMVSPVKLSDVPAAPTSARKPVPANLIPRCDDVILKSRGDCIDSTAGLKLVPRDVELSKDYSAANAASRDLLFMRQKDTAIVSSPQPLTGPVIYEFQLAHK